MFEESLLESTHLIRSQSRWPAVASFALQATIATVLMAIPVLHPEVLPLRIHPLEFTPPPPRVPPPQPVIQRVRMENVMSSVPSMPSTPETLAEPRLPSKGLDPTKGSDAPATGPVTMGNGSSDVGTLIGSNTSGSHNNIVVANPSKIVRLSTGVSVGLLIAPIKPVYPRIAVAAGQQGTVIIHAMISKEGKIESANAVSGPMMLQGAALDAVRNARYHPFLLNGEPTEVDTTFSIVFHLGGS